MFKNIYFAAKCPYIATDKKHVRYITKWFTEVFSKQLLDMVNGKIECQENTDLIKLPERYYNVVDSTIKLIRKRICKYMRQF